MLEKFKELIWAVEVCEYCAKIIKHIDLEYCSGCGSKLGKIELILVVKEDGKNKF